MASQYETRTRKPGLRLPGMLLVFAACFGLFCLFTAKLSGPELVLAALSSSACVLFAMLLVRCAPPVRFSATDVMQGWRVPGYIVQRVVQISWLLLRDMCGKHVSSIFRQTAFRGECRNASDAGRRVLATVYTTAAPNFIVLQIDAKEHELHFHQLTRTNISDMLQNLGAAE